MIYNEQKCFFVTNNYLYKSIPSTVILMATILSPNWPYLPEGFQINLKRDMFTQNVCNHKKIGILAQWQIELRWDWLLGFERQICIGFLINRQWDVIRGRWWLKGSQSRNKTNLGKGPNISLICNKLVICHFESLIIAQLSTLSGIALHWLHQLVLSWYNHQPESHQPKV